MITFLKPQDLPELKQGAINFFKEGSLPGRFNPDYFISRWTDLLKSGQGVIIGSYGPSGEIHGALGAVLYKDMNNGDYTAVESFWYVIEEYRGRGLALLKAFEEWARSVGAKRVSMIHLLQLQPEKLKDLYERLGYRAIEVNYIKDLN